MGARTLLDVRHLSVSFATRAGPLRAVDGVDFHVDGGEIVGLVGESGSGKSTAGLALMRLLPPSATIDPGSRVELRGRDLVSVPLPEMRRLRGNEISMTFQDPMTFLNPVMRIGPQITEAITQHRDVSGREARAIALEWIANVRITEPARVYEAYPFQLSGGMRQRILIAIALACDPSLLIADEPTTALDVTIQREILELVLSVRDRYGTSILLITHDLGVVAEICDRVYVMYAGRIVEHGRVDSVLVSPRNPYTAALMRSARSIDEFQPVLYALPGTVPSPLDLPTGCRFRDRCPEAFDRCVEEPPLMPLADAAASRCWLAEPTALAGALGTGPRDA